MTRRCGYHELAKYLGIPVGTARSMVSRKQIPHIRLTARLVVFDLDVIDAWIAERSVAAGGGQ